MMKNYLSFILALFALVVVTNCNAQKEQAIKVELVKKGGNWQMLRGGEPYYIKGAGNNGLTQIDAVREVGGNSIRTWHYDNALEILDKAHENGLTVMMGFWVGVERQGFDYNDEEAVKTQLENFTKVVKELKDHPALLLWGVGNEVDLFYSNTKVWDAIQDICKMIHEVDPNHPTSTVTAGLDPKEVALILEKTPDLDIYAVNTYGEIGGVAENIMKYGWEKPLIIAEWGPTGHWEVEKTVWNVPVEQSSSEKFDIYMERYQKYIEPFNSNCIGSYVFQWGQKQETTSTWYGLFTKDGKRTEVLDAVEFVWKGKYPEERAARINNATINGMAKGEDIRLSKNQKCEAEVLFSSTSKAKISWEITKESDDIKVGGDKESAPPPVTGLIKKKKGKTMTFRAPNEEGAYRLYLFITTKENKVSYINVPFFVDGLLKPEKTPVWLKPTKLNTDA